MQRRGSRSSSVETAEDQPIAHARGDARQQRATGRASRQRRWSRRKALRQAIQSQAARIAELGAGLSAAIQALEEAEEDVEHWGGYASEYFRDKHDLDGDLDRIAKQAAHKGRQMSSTSTSVPQQ